MPVSDKHKFIFVHIPKCAGTSIEKSLQNHTKLTFIENTQQIQERLGVDHWFLETNPHKHFKHAFIRDIQKLIDTEKFNTYFKFSFVRNPFARLLSYYSYMKKVNARNITKKHVKLVCESNSLKEFVLKALEDSELNYLFCQYLYITDKNLTNQMDFIGKVENLQKDFDYVTKQVNLNNNLLAPIYDRLGVSRIKLPKLNVSQSKNYRDCYDDELKKKVTRACEIDLDFYKYTF